MTSLLIKNCRLIYKGSNVVRHIYIENGKIAAITKELRNADKILNANGNYVIPGLIDSHVHFRDPGMEHKEDFLTGSKAAAAGGVTTVLDMPNTKPPCITVKALERKRQIAAKKSVVNYGFHFGATLDNLNELEEVDNIASVKVYMGSSTGDLLVDDDGALFEIFSKAKICTLHAESEPLIKHFTEKYHDYKVADVHCDIRTNMVAAEAVSRALTLAKYTGVKLYFAHTSTKDELDLLAGRRAFVEVTPHHLFLSEKDMSRLDNFGKMNPPLRSKKDMEALWNGIKVGAVHTIATDHAPHTIAEKQKDYWNAPSGVPGVETMLPLLLNEVNNGNLSLTKVVELTSINPAKIFGIKNKGFIKEGFDADLTIIDLNMVKRVNNDELFTKCKWSPFHGWKLQGWPVTTIVNGNVVFHDGEVNERYHGKEVQFKDVKEE
ncbi:dihydroorotase [Candidatus Woesearchaeota archaeon]|nr:dihydroorotase [Candidatus Woesearchaeota archaeon]